jgi:hypothetical protein
MYKELLADIHELKMETNEFALPVLTKIHVPGELLS